MLPRLCVLCVREAGVLLREYALRSEAPRDPQGHSPQAVHHGSWARHKAGGLSLRARRIAARTAL